jgi:hypothetical protein
MRGSFGMRQRDVGVGALELVLEALADANGPPPTGHQDGALAFADGVPAFHGDARTMPHRAGVAAV